MHLTIHRGTEEIGGSCVEVESRETRILLDIGSPLPALDDSSPVSSIPVTLREKWNPDRIDGVFLTHAHGDHTGLLEKLPREIPVYLTRITSKMLLAGDCYAHGRANLSKRIEHILHPWAPVTCGDIKVTPIPVDHSVPGAVALLVTSGSHRLIYTGDLRWNGPAKETIDHLITHESCRNPDVLLMEGTTLGQPPRDPTTEADLTKRITTLLQASSGLALTMFSPQNVDRLHTMIEAARRSGRHLVLDDYSLFVLHLLRKEPGLNSSHEWKGSTRVWLRHERDQYRKGPLRNAEDFIDELMITKEEMLESPSKLVLSFRSGMARAHPELLPPSDLAIWSYWQGYTATASVSALREKLASHKIVWEQAHASGHINPADACAFVAAIAPKQLIPIHTESADEYSRFFLNQKIVRLCDGEPFHLEENCNEHVVS